MFEVRRTAEFSEWLGALADIKARAAILARILRLGRGNPGDVKSVGSGVSELRIDVGPGYRAYYMRVGQQVLLMLGGGDKSSQAQDIRRVTKMADALRTTAKPAQPRRSK
jgi:putative addiction module killer protein